MDSLAKFSLVTRNAVQMALTLIWFQLIYLFDFSSVFSVVDCRLLTFAGRTFVWLFISRCWKLQQCFTPPETVSSANALLNQFIWFDLPTAREQFDKSKLPLNWQMEGWHFTGKSATLVGASTAHEFSLSLSLFLSLPKSNQCKSQWRQLLYNKLASLSLNEWPLLVLDRSGRQQPLRRLPNERGHTHTSLVIFLLIYYEKLLDEQATGRVLLNELFYFN